MDINIPVSPRVLKATKRSSPQVRQQSSAPGILSGSRWLSSPAWCRVTAPPWVSSLHQVAAVHLEAQTLICHDVLLGLLLPPTKTVQEIRLNSYPHSKRTPQHKLPNQKFGNQQMPNIVFMLLLHFLYLCYHLNCFVTSHVSKNTYFVQHTYQGTHL